MELPLYLSTGDPRKWQFHMVQLTVYFPWPADPALGGLPEAFSFILSFSLSVCLVSDFLDCVSV